MQPAELVWYLFNFLDQQLERNFLMPGTGFLLNYLLLLGKICHPKW